MMLFDDDAIDDDAIDDDALTNTDNDTDHDTPTAFVISHDIKSHRKS
jgi:hypothetical protein